MGCCSSDKPKWKREIVPDHKFDNIDLDAFYNPSCKYRLSHLTVYLLTVKSFAVYIADLWTAVSLLVIGQTTTTPAIPTEISKWLFFACIMFSFLVLIWDMFKARRILKTRDISYAFTSTIANRYLSMKDYRTYCLFKSINAKSKGIESYAFFVFFQLKGWKRLLLAEAPRQVINIVTLEAIAPDWLKIHNGSVSIDNQALGENTVQQILTLTMAFSVLVFAISFILVCAALVLYIPLFCHIRGNLKEYCCHKVDKRIAEILKSQGYRRKAKNTPPTEVFFEKNEYYKRPLMSSPSPMINNNYEQPSYFQKLQMASPVMTPQQRRDGEQYLLSNEQDGYYEDTGPYHNTYRQYSPQLSLSSPPPQASPFPQFRSNGYAPISSPSLPSSTCANEQRYQVRNYP